jgi:hypothetical protein
MKEVFGWRFIVSYCNLLWLRVIVKEWSINPIIQSRTRLISHPRTWQYYKYKIIVSYIQTFTKYKVAKKSLYKYIESVGSCLSALVNLSLAEYERDAFSEFVKDMNIMTSINGRKWNYKMEASLRWYLKHVIVHLAGLMLPEIHAFLLAYAVVPRRPSYLETEYFQYEDTLFICVIATLFTNQCTYILIIWKRSHLGLMCNSFSSTNIILIDH